MFWDIFPTGAPRASKSSQSPNLSAPPAHFDQLVCLVHCSDQHHWSAVQSTKLQFCPPWFYLILSTALLPSTDRLQCNFCGVLLCWSVRQKYPLGIISHFTISTTGWILNSERKLLKIWDSISHSTQCPARVGFGQSRSEKWRKIHLLFSRRASEKKWLDLIEIEKWKWNKNDWKSRSRSKSEMKKLRDREVKFLENFRESKNHSWRTWFWVLHPPWMAKKNYETWCQISLFFPFHSFWEMKVKKKWLEIEIEKWNKNCSRSEI